MSTIYNPSVLFLDEPTASMDPISRRHISDSIIHFKENKKGAIVYCTHLLEELNGVATRIAFLEGGNIIRIGKPIEIKKMLGQK